MSVTGAVPGAQAPWTNSQAGAPGGEASVQQPMYQQQQQVAPSVQQPVVYQQQQPAASSVQQPVVYQQQQAPAQSVVYQQQQPTAPSVQQPIVYQQPASVQPVYQQQQPASIPVQQPQVTDHMYRPEPRQSGFNFPQSVLPTAPVQQAPLREDPAKKAAEVPLPTMSDIYDVIAKTGNVGLASQVQSMAMKLVADAEKDANDLIQSQGEEATKRLAEIVRSHACGSDDAAQAILDAAERVGPEGRLCDFMAQVQGSFFGVTERMHVKSTAGGSVAVAPIVNAPAAQNVAPVSQQPVQQTQGAWQQQTAAPQQPMQQTAWPAQPMQYQQQQPAPQYQQQQYQQPAPQQQQPAVQYQQQQQQQQPQAQQAAPPASPYAAAHTSTPMTRHNYRAPGQSKWNFAKPQSPAPQQVSVNSQANAQPQQPQQQQQQAQQQPAGAPKVLSSRASNSFTIGKRQFNDPSLDGFEEYMSNPNKQSRL